MVSNKDLDRREFLCLSALAAAAIVLPDSLHATPSSESGLVTLQVIGDPQQGFGVTILYRGQAIARHHQGGEFSAVFQNSERSLEDRTDNWKATAWTGNPTQVKLSGDAQLKNLRTTVSVEVCYEVLPSQVVKKTIELRQADMFTLYYQLTNRLEPATAPEKLWSFDHADCKGGALHEYFPAAGFRTQEGLTVGLLTDSGYRNQWSRIIRRDGTPVKPAPFSTPDLNLYYLPYAADRSEQGAYIQQTFGEATIQLSGKGSRTPVNLPAPSLWKRDGNIQVEQRDGVIKLSPSTMKDFVLLPFPAKGGEVFSVHLKYRSTAAVSVHAWDTDDQRKKLGDITLFNDTAPASPSTISEFRNSFVVPALQGTGAALVLSLPDFEVEGMHSDEGTLPAMEVQSIELFRIATRTEPYHRLEMGKAQARTMFIFASDSVPDTIRGYRLSSQLHLAEGLGFKGGETEKVLYRSEEHTSELQSLRHLV